MGQVNDFQGRDICYISCGNLHFPKGMCMKGLNILLLSDKLNF